MTRYLGTPRFCAESGAGHQYLVPSSFSFPPGQPSPPLPLPPLIVWLPTSALTPPGRCARIPACFCCVQHKVLADSYGNVAAFPERECSVQRRNQKVGARTIFFQIFSPRALIPSPPRRTLQQPEHKKKGCPALLFLSKESYSFGYSPHVAPLPGVSQKLFRWSLCISHSVPSYQVLEESPSCLITPEVRLAMQEQAIMLSKATGYR